MTPLSAVLITKDEESKVGAAIESVRFCDEIVVVDGGSKDKTRQIAEDSGARVLLNTPWPGFVGQRNVAVDAARNDWIVALDADERITPQLRAEIEALCAAGFRHAGYRIPRVALYLGRWIRATDWYPDPQVRLFDRRRGRWEGALVHESVRVRGSVGRLHADMEHHPYGGISDHLRKIDTYTTLWAQQSFDLGHRTGPFQMMGAAAWAFFRNYGLRGGLRLGVAGLTISTLNAYYTFAKLAKLYELTRVSPPR